MNIYVFRVVCTAALALFMMGAFAQSTTLEPARLAPEDLKWTTTPMGTQRAILAGDDRKAGMYAYRARFPANFRNAPHFHPDDRIVTVISGTLYVGSGSNSMRAR
jgi:hypothetical protein